MSKTTWAIDAIWHKLRFKARRQLWRRFASGSTQQRAIIKDLRSTADEEITDDTLAWKVLALFLCCAANRGRPDVRHAWRSETAGMADAAAGGTPAARVPVWCRRHH